MGGRFHEQSVRPGNLGAGNPAQYDYEAISTHLKGAQPVSLAAVGRAYAQAQAALHQAESGLADHVKRLNSVWKGDAQELGIGDLKRLTESAKVLAEASGKFQSAMNDASSVLRTAHSTMPHRTTAPSAPWPLKSPSTPDKGSLAAHADDKIAQQHLAKTNTALNTAYTQIPTAIAFDLPGGKVFDEDFSPESSLNSGISGGSSGGGGSSNDSLNPQHPFHNAGAEPGMPGGSPSGGSGSGGGNVPGNSDPSGGGNPSELEGTPPISPGQPGGAPPSLPHPGPSPAQPPSGGHPPGLPFPGPTAPSPGRETGPRGRQGTAPVLPPAQTPGRPGIGPPTGVGRTTPTAPTTPASTGVLGSSAGGGARGQSPTTHPTGAPTPRGGVIGGTGRQSMSGDPNVRNSPARGAFGASAGVGGNRPSRRTEADDQRNTWLTDDEDLWGDNDVAAPRVVGEPEE